MLKRYKVKENSGFTVIIHKGLYYTSGEIFEAEPHQIKGQEFKVTELEDNNDSIKNQLENLNSLADIDDKIFNTIDADGMGTEENKSLIDAPNRMMKRKYTRKI